MGITWVSHSNRAGCFAISSLSAIFSRFSSSPFLPKGSERMNQGRVPGNGDNHRSLRRGSDGRPVHRQDAYHETPSGSKQMEAARAGSIRCISVAAHLRSHPYHWYPIAQLALDARSAEFSGQYSHWRRIDGLVSTTDLY